jgi:rubrerythrin
MIGVIRTRDIIAHPLVTAHCFGWPLFFRALVAGRRKTFLSLLARSSALRPATVEVPALLGRCLDLESRARRIYELLAARFSDRAPVRRFFETLARQEQEHFELLALCRQLASQEGWLEEFFAPWRDAVPRLERQMDEAEEWLPGLDRLSDALRLVIRLEGSEINHVFRGAVSATDSEFVRTLQAFRNAEAKHIAYACEQIASLAPELAGDCSGLRAAHSNMRRRSDADHLGS